jgi:hypothetical protein
MARGDGPGQAPSSPIYWTILAVLVADVVIGAVMALVGDLVMHNEAVKTFGVALAGVGAVLYLFFRVWGRRWIETYEKKAGGKNEGGRG